MWIWNTGQVWFWLGGGEECYDYIIPGFHSHLYILNIYYLKSNPPPSQLLLKAMLQLKDFKQKDQTSGPGSQEQRYRPISSQLTSPNRL